MIISQCLWELWKYFWKTNCTRMQPGHHQDCAFSFNTSSKMVCSYFIPFFLSYSKGKLGYIDQAQSLNLAINPKSRYLCPNSNVHWCSLLNFSSKYSTMELGPANWSIFYSCNVEVFDLICSISCRIFWHTSTSYRQQNTRLWGDNYTPSHTILC